MRAVHTDSDTSSSDDDNFDKLVSQLKVNPRYEPILKRRRLEEVGAEQSEDEDLGDVSDIEGEVQLSTQQLKEIRSQYGENVEIVLQEEHEELIADDDSHIDDNHERTSESDEASSVGDASDGNVEDAYKSSEDESDDDSLSVDSDGISKTVQLDYGFYGEHFFHQQQNLGKLDAVFTDVINAPPDLSVKARVGHSQRQQSFLLHPSSEELLSNWPGNQLQSSSTLKPSPIAPILSRYQDLVYSCCQAGQDFAIRDAFLSHIVRHLLYGRRKIAEGDQLLATDPDAEVRDQGFTQAKILILCPFKSSSFDIINRLLDLLPHKYTRQISNRNRFIEEFGPPTLDDDELARFNAKPELYRSVINGNFEDTFRIGVKIGRRSVKLYSEFFSSDIIIASPLGLRMIVGGEGDKPSEREFDFLSSIEIMVLDQADIFTMQNWEHVSTVLDCCNQIPRDGAHTDFSRVHPWHLDGLSSQYRQMLIFSSHCLPEINALASKHCHSASGTIRIRQKCFEGVLEKVVRPIRQHFQRFHPGNSVLEASKARFQWFSSVILPQLKENLSAQILIFIPSYFDYVRVRNLLRTQKVKVALCSEYTKKGSVARARSRFYHGQQKFLVCTERFHFFRRYCIRGAHTVFFYNVPQEPEFYLDFLNAIEADSQQTSLTLFSRFDFLALERIVGSTRAAQLISADKDLHLFC